MNDYQYPNSKKSLEVVKENSGHGPRATGHGDQIPELKPDASLKEKVIATIRTIYDPELPVNIYDLGLIYDIAIDAENRVHVKMTLTAPACPVAGSLPPEVERKIECIDEVKSATVELVWDPPWSREKMSEAALLELGLM